MSARHLTLPRFANLRSDAEIAASDRRAHREALSKRASGAVIALCWLGMLGLGVWAVYGLLADPLAASIVDSLDPAKFTR